ncbi:UDP-N-acetylmuramate--L-alanine ligase [Candidatus Gracilibacteria bacterium]|nr:UDP-N-acetylmuramate--L-alanine ligase [Candidatus Gracilibacteria bacterium]MCF7855942.1 UDP-N-acetylmuramate--L-alanine ligase [Candidatus Gracilibacteria bacterium]MCF7896365.1 UDP-N-acetylmuramate--L-alanine ligase [Candidatus Gracilibacteria bacterium]
MFSEQNFHLVGIGGIGMSGLARLLQNSGKAVTGSDAEASPITEKLKSEKFSIAIPQKAENIPENCDVVVHTLAVDSSNPEIVAAQKRGLKILSYPQALGSFLVDKKVIAVAGTHGKTTTTGLIVAGCLAAGEDISCLVGTNLPMLDGQNARLGKSEWFVIEACEYRRAFLNFNPQVLVVTNAEAEHLDYYKDWADYESAFVEFTQKLPPDGVLVANSHERNLDKIIATAPHFFDAGGVFENFQLKIPGEMNRWNAKLALVVGELLDLDSEKFHEGLANFAGGERRFELRGEFHGAQIFDDYAHHPTEIIATLEAAREKFPDQKITVVYQQHQLDRAAKMLKEIGVSFLDADRVVIPNIYAVRDEASSAAKISGKELAAEIAKSGVEAIFTENFPKTVAWLKANLQKDEVAIVMGAGDVFQISAELLAS